MKLVKQAESFKERLIYLSDHGLLKYHECIKIDNELDFTINQFKYLPDTQENQEVILILLMCKIETQMALTWLEQQDLNSA